MRDPAPVQRRRAARAHHGRSASAQERSSKQRSPVRPSAPGWWSVQSSKSSLAALTLGAIGVVYGDIGTSVLYAVNEVFGSGHVPFTQSNVYGILSIFFLTPTGIFFFPYLLLLLRALPHRDTRPLH